MDTNVTPLVEVRGCRQSYHKDSATDLVVLDDVNVYVPKRLCIS